MPSGKNWIHFFYINLLFFIYIIAVFYFSQIAIIKANWPLYRCNPIYMPLADNLETNFSYCISSIQTNLMGNLLQPLTFITSSLSDMFGNFMEEINSIRAMIDKIRSLFSSIIESVFGIFLNIIIEFQKIIISIKDLVGKTIGILVSLMYVLDGSILTMNSAWNAPPGQLVKSLGKCFYPNTNIKLKNQTIKFIKNINLGDILEDGSIVEAVMKIDNKIDNIPLYVIKKNGINKENIYVTGSHLVYDSSQNKFIKVENYNKAVLSKKKTKFFSCLITNTHKIQINNEIFWDWEDYLLKMSNIE